VTLSTPPSPNTDGTAPTESVQPTPKTAETETPAARSSQSGTSFSGVMVSTFVTILLAEMGDKTQLTTLLMTAKSQLPGVVLLGSATALILTSLLGVMLGCWLANRVSPNVLNRSAGIILVFVAIAQAWELLH
jgi:Ca2+/H+ antiporter, TMEM165/GDT1 family